MMNCATKEQIASGSKHPPAKARELVHICPSKLSRRELEDLYFTLLQNNLNLKKSSNNQEEKLKILTTKLNRMTASLKAPVENSALGKDIKSICNKYNVVIAEQQQRITDMQKTVERLKTRIRQLNMQMSSTRQFLRRDPVTPRSMKSQSASSGTAKILSTSALSPKRHNTNVLHAISQSCQCLDSKDKKVSTSLKDVQTETTRDMIPDKLSAENKTHMAELKQKIANLQEELFGTHEEYCARITQLEQEVLQLHKENMRVSSNTISHKQDMENKAQEAEELQGRLRQAEGKCGELEAKLSIEQSRVAELLMQVKAANMSTKVAETYEKLANNKTAGSGSNESSYYSEEVGTTAKKSRKVSKEKLVDEFDYEANDSVKKVMSPDSYVTDADMLMSHQASKKSDDSGYTDANKSQGSEADKEVVKINQDLLTKIIELQSQLDALKATAFQAVESPRQNMTALNDSSIDSQGGKTKEKKSKKVPKKDSTVDECDCDVGDCLGKVVESPRQNMTALNDSSNDSQEGKTKEKKSKKVPKEDNTVDECDCDVGDCLEKKEQSTNRSSRSDANKGRKGNEIDDSSINCKKELQTNNALGVGFHDFSPDLTTTSKTVNRENDQNLKYSKYDDDHNKYQIPGPLPVTSSNRQSESLPPNRNQRDTYSRDSRIGSRRISVQSQDINPSTRTVEWDSESNRSIYHKESMQIGPARKILKDKQTGLGDDIIKVEDAARPSNIPLDVNKPTTSNAKNSSTVQGGPKNITDTFEKTFETPNNVRELNSKVVQLQGLQEPSTSKRENDVEDNNPLDTTYLPSPICSNSNFVTPENQVNKECNCGLTSRVNETNITQGNLNTRIDRPQPVNENQSIPVPVSRLSSKRGVSENLERFVVQSNLTSTAYEPIGIEDDEKTHGKIFGIDQNKQTYDAKTDIQTELSAPTENSTEENNQLSVCEQYVQVCNCPRTPRRDVAVFRSCSGTLRFRTTSQQASKFRRCDCGNDNKTDIAYKYIETQVSPADLKPQTAQVVDYSKTRNPPRKNATISIDSSRVAAAQDHISQAEQLPEFPRLFSETRDSLTLPKTPSRSFQKQNQSPRNLAFSTQALKTSQNLQNQTLNTENKTPTAKQSALRSGMSSIISTQPPFLETQLGQRQSPGRRSSATFLVNQEQTQVYQRNEQCLDRQCPKTVLKYSKQPSGSKLLPQGQLSQMDDVIQASELQQNDQLIQTAQLYQPRRRSDTITLPRTYNLIGEAVVVQQSRCTSPANTEHEISSMTDLPSERETAPGFSRWSPRSPGEDKATSTLTESSTMPSNPTYDSLSEGELPWERAGRLSSHLSAKKAMLLFPGKLADTSTNVETTPVPLNSSDKMEAALQAIGEELARCRQLLLRNRRSEEVPYRASVV